MVYDNHVRPLFDRSKEHYGIYRQVCWYNYRKMPHINLLCNNTTNKFSKFSLLNCVIKFVWFIHKTVEQALCRRGILPMEFCEESFMLKVKPFLIHWMLQEYALSTNIHWNTCSALLNGPSTNRWMMFNTLIHFYTSPYQSH